MCVCVTVINVKRTGKFILYYFKIFLSLNSCIVAIDLANMLPIVGQIERYGSVSDAIRIRADSLELLRTSAVRRVMPNMSSW